MKKNGKRLALDLETLKNLRIDELVRVPGAGLGILACSNTCKTNEVSRCICNTF